MTVKFDLYLESLSSANHLTERNIRFTLVNVNAPVVATTSWWLHFSAQVVA